MFAYNFERRNKKNKIKKKHFSKTASHTVPYMKKYNMQLPVVG